MAIQRYKVALNNALFPLVSTKAQRTVFVPGLDRIHVWRGGGCKLSNTPNRSSIYACFQSAMWPESIGQTTARFAATARH